MYTVLNRSALVFSVAAFCSSVLADGLMVSSLEKIGDCENLNITYAVNDRSIDIHFIDHYKIAIESGVIKSNCILNFEIQDTPGLEAMKNFVYTGKTVIDYSMTGKIASSLRILGNVGGVDVVNIAGDSDIYLQHVTEPASYTTQENSILEYRIDLTLWGEQHVIGKESFVTIKDSTLNL